MYKNFSDNLSALPRTHYWCNWNINLPQPSPLLAKFDKIQRVFWKYSICGHRNNGGWPRRSNKVGLDWLLPNRGYNRAVQIVTVFRYVQTNLRKTFTRQCLKSYLYIGTHKTWNILTHIAWISYKADRQNLYV